MKEKILILFNSFKEDLTLKKNEREDDDEQRSQNRNHHQSKQGNGQPKNDRPFPDVFIDFEPFHLYNDSY